MKIKIAILDSDKNYLSRMVSAFSARYSEKTEIYSFTELDAAVRCIKENKIDIFQPVSKPPYPNRIWGLIMLLLANIYQKRYI